MDTIRIHIRNVEELTVGRDAAVLRHAARLEFQVTEYLPRRDVHLDNLAGELARRDHVAAIGSEVSVIDSRTVYRHLMNYFHCLGVAEIDSLHTLCHDNCVLPVGRVVHVVGIIHRDRLAFFPGSRINGSQLITQILRNPELL